jgi:aspartyl-tRNA(Asn)/glutamyl-tRNA(Gln) amidotransferase subunit B
VAQALADNPKAVADYVNGKDTAARFLVGQVMKITRGQAKPELALELVQAALDSIRDSNIDTQD